MTLRAPWKATTTRTALALLLSLAAAGPALAALPARHSKPAPSASGIANQSIASQKGPQIPGAVFLSEERSCEPAETICRWYEQEYGDYCEYVWCMQRHVQMGLIPFSCMYNYAQLSASSC
jgi:hypothetical protein